MEGGELVGRRCWRGGTSLGTTWAPRRRRHGAAHETRETRPQGNAARNPRTPPQLRGEQFRFGKNEQRQLLLPAEVVDVAHHLHEAPPARAEHELEEQMSERSAGDRHLEFARVREVDLCFTARRMHLLKEHLARRPVAPREPRRGDARRRTPASWYRGVDHQARC